MWQFTDNKKQILYEREQFLKYILNNKLKYWKKLILKLFGIRKGVKILKIEMELEKHDITNDTLKLAVNKDKYKFTDYQHLIDKNVSHKRIAEEYLKNK